MLEQLYQEEWLAQKAKIAFLIGASYSVIGIFSAMVLFPYDPGLASVSLTSLLLLPTLHNLLSIEAGRMAREARFSVARLLWDHWDIISLYWWVFLGSFLTFGFFAAMWPKVATSAVFIAQTRATVALGMAGKSAVMMEYIFNNGRVLLISLLMSFFYGAGAVFIIIWNASAWGVFFGGAARESAGALHPLLHFLYTVMLVLPHVVLEAGSYFLAATSGGIISKAAIRERLGSSRFKRLILDGFYLFVLAALLMVVAAYVETYITPWLLQRWGL